MGLKRDIAIRVHQVRQFMVERVTAARNFIYRHGAPIKGKNVEDLLKDFSGVPTQVGVEFCVP